MDSDPVPAHVEPILSLIRAVSALTGLEVVWKDAVGSHPPQVPRVHREHQNPFCQAVKKSQARLRRCKLDDDVEVMRQARASDRPYIKTCHAGVEELVVPLCLGGQCQGALFVGPMRAVDGGCPVRAAAAAFARLPQRSEVPLTACQDLLQPLVAFLLQRVEAAGLQETTVGPSAPMAAALAYIRARLDQPLRASAVAAHVHLSPSRFIHRFKDELGVPFSTFVQRSRVEQARKLLLHTDLPIADVAGAVGFVDANYFARVFRQHEKCAPTAFRKQRSGPSQP